LGLEDPFELTGVYQGRDLAHRSVLDVAPLPAEVVLFRRPILDEWAENGQASLGELIAHVLIHEIGHHFGLSDSDIEMAEDS
jgi:predicted Zn-dependent protease with MMP-like domain